MINKVSQLIILLMVIILIGGLSGCSGKEPASSDIITQTVISPDKTPITLLVKYAFIANSFEEAAEKEFPQLDIIQVGNYTVDMGIAEYEARLKNDDLTDIVMTWPVSVGEEYWEDRLIDLSSMSFSSKYNTAMLNDISQGGELYYLPGPAQVRGIVYNKTLFEEKGWKVPTDFNSFVDLCQTIEAAGIRSLQLGLANDEVLDTAFVGFGYENSYSKPANTQKINEYNNGTGSFSDNFTPALDTFEVLIDKGILKKGDLKIDYSTREKMLFTRQCAMVEDSVIMARMGDSYNGCTDQFALMPFFNPGTNSDWARLYPVCYIGVNKNLTTSQNKEKYDLVMELLEYISTPDGQKALAGDTGAMFSNLNGLEPPDVPEIKDLIPALTNGRYARFPTLKNAQNALRKGLAGMVDGSLTSEDVVKMVDRENLSPPAPEVPAFLGSAKEDFTLMQTGEFITDALRSQSKSDIALFLDNGKDGKYNGKGVSARFYKGDLTTADLKRVLPDRKSGDKGEMWKIIMTGQDLLTTLEYSIPVENNRSGWFYYFSGLRMEYDPTAKPGKRIKSITDDQGKDIVLDKKYSIAIMGSSVPNNLIISCKKTGVLISEVLEKAIKDQKIIEPNNDQRFTVYNNN